MTLNANALGQSQINVVQAPANEGDFCDSNPRFTVDAGQFGMVAGAAGLTVGRFAWLTYPPDNDGTPIVANNFGFGLPAGLVHREQQGLITTYLASSGMLQPLGFEATLFNGGGFWLKNGATGAAACLYQMKAYANYATGQVRFGLTGAPLVGGSGTASSVAASTFSVTGSITGSTLTVTVVGSGTVVPGATISGTGIPTGSQIVSQLTGTTGGVGTYQINGANLSVASTTVSGTYGTLTVGGTVVTGFAVNQLINGTGVAANTFITALGTGTGGAGTYIVNNNTVVSSTTITAYVDIETKWVAMSQGAINDLIKTSSQTLG